MADQLNLSDLVYRLGFSNEDEFLRALDGIFKKAEKEAGESATRTGLTFSQRLKQSFQQSAAGLSLKAAFDKLENEAAVGATSSGNAFTQRFKTALLSSPVAGVVRNLLEPVEGTARAAGRQAGEGFIRDFKSALGTITLGSFLGNALANAFGQTLGAAREFAGESVREFARYEQGLKQLQLAGETNLKGLETRISAASEASKVFSETDVSAAVGELVKQGNSAEQAFALVQQGALLAGAEVDETGLKFGNLGKTSVQLGNVMEALELDFSQTARVTDVLAKSAQASGLEVSTLVDVVAGVGPAAKTANVSLEDVSAAAAVLSKRGLDASTITTGLRGVISTLVDPPKQVRGEFDRLGLTLVKADGSTRPFLEVLRNLERVTAAGGRGAQLLASGFDTFQLSVASSLGQANQDIAEFRTGLDDADGSAQKLADTIQDSTTGAIAAANREIDNAKKSLGEQLVPAMKTLYTQVLPPVVTWLGYVVDKLGLIFARAQDAARAIGLIPDPDEKLRRSRLTSERDAKSTLVADLQRQLDELKKTTPEKDDPRRSIPQRAQDALNRAKIANLEATITRLNEEINQVNRQLNSLERRNQPAKPLEPTKPPSSGSSSGTGGKPTPANINLPSGSGGEKKIEFPGGDAALLKRARDLETALRAANTEQEKLAASNAIAAFEKKYLGAAEAVRIVGKELDETAQRERTADAELAKVRAANQFEAFERAVRNASTKRLKALEGELEVEKKLAKTTEDRQLAERQLSVVQRELQERTQDQIKAERDLAELRKARSLEIFEDAVGNASTKRLRELQTELELAKDTAKTTQARAEALQRLQVVERELTDRAREQRDIDRERAQIAADRARDRLKTDVDNATDDQLLKAKIDANTILKKDIKDTTKAEQDAAREKLRLVDAEIDRRKRLRDDRRRDALEAEEFNRNDARLAENIRRELEQIATMPAGSILEVQAALIRLDAVGDDLPESLRASANALRQFLNAELQRLQGLAEGATGAVEDLKDMVSSTSVDLADQAGMENYQLVMDQIADATATAFDETDVLDDKIARLEALLTADMVPALRTTIQAQLDLAKRLRASRDETASFADETARAAEELRKSADAAEQAFTGANPDRQFTFNVGNIPDLNALKPEELERELKALTDRQLASVSLLTLSEKARLAVIAERNRRLKEQVTLEQEADARVSDAARAAGELENQAQVASDVAGAIEEIIAGLDPSNLSSVEDAINQLEGLLSLEGLPPKLKARLEELKTQYQELAKIAAQATSAGQLEADRARAKADVISPEDFARSFTSAQEQAVRDAALQAQLEGRNVAEATVPILRQQETALQELLATTDQGSAAWREYAARLVEVRNRLDDITLDRATKAQKPLRDLGLLVPDLGKDRTEGKDRTDKKDRGQTTADELEQRITDIGIGFGKDLVNGVVSGDLGGALQKVLGSASDFFVTEMLKGIIGPIAQELTKTILSSTTSSAAGGAAAGLGALGPAGIAIGVVALLGSVLLPNILNPPKAVNPEPPGGRQQGSAPAIEYNAIANVNFSSSASFADPAFRAAYRAETETLVTNLLERLGLIDPKGGKT